MLLTYDNALKADDIELSLCGSTALLARPEGGGFKVGRPGCSGVREDFWLRSK